MMADIYRHYTPRNLWIYHQIESGLCSLISMLSADKAAIIENEINGGVCFIKRGLWPLKFDHPVDDFTVESLFGA